MKLLPVLLGVSLAANAALITVNRFGDAPPGRSRVGSGSTSAHEIALRFEKPQGPASGDGKAIAAALQGDDLERLRDELRASGLDEESVRAIVGVRLWKRYEARLKALQPAPDPNRPWWKNDDDSRQTREQREESRRLREEQRAEAERILGKDPRGADANPWLARQYGFIATEKREDLQKLEQDYRDLSEEFRREARGFMLPSDQEKLKFLEEEKRRDLASLLTPQEFADYEMRQSRTAQNLRWRMTQMDASEAEFRTIFELQKDFDERFSEHDQYGNRMRNMTPDDWKARSEAEKTMKAQLRDALGTERYAAYVRSQDGDYQQLRNATKRFDLPADTPDKIFALRDEVPRRANKIADDASLTPEQKRAELKKLAEETRNRVSTTLGSEAAQAYLTNGMQWVKQLERGSIVSFDENGAQTNRRIENPPKPAGGAKK